MTTDELYDLFRSDVVDTARPYLWSDNEVYAYMNDAYYMFVRLLGGISDYSSDACYVPVIIGQAVAEIDPSILRIRQATLSNGRDVRIINAQDTTHLNDEDFGVLRRLNMTDSTGAVRYMVIGLEPDNVRWVNIPDQNDTVNLLIERLPRAPLTDNSSSIDDVKPHHHIHFLKWMKHLAYNKHDAETFNKTKSEEMKIAFYEYCDLARREKEVAKHKPRVVAYGGI